MASGGFNQCSICLEDFKKPKFLDCHHTFCMECIRDLEGKSPGTVSCPLCQRKVQLPAGGVDQLTSNFYILNININKPGDGLQTVISRADSSRKTIYVEYNGNDTDAEFNGVTFNFQLSCRKTDKWGDVLCVRIRISEPRSPFISSCDIEYDISLVNQKDRNYSVQVNGYCLRKFSDDIHLVKKSEAFNVNNGFIVTEREDEYNRMIPTFKLGVNIKVNNKKMKNFNLI